MIVRFTPRAIEQLEIICIRIARENPAAAAIFLRHVDALGVLLGTRPFMDRPTNRANVRIISARGYPCTVSYLVVTAGDEKHILRVRHAARQ